MDIARLAVITSFFGKKDFTYLYAQVQWWDMLHTSLGIIAICLPTIRILLSWIGEVLSRRSQFSSNTKASATDRKNLWQNNKKNYNELNEVELSLTGEAGLKVHNNTIALALRQPSQGTTLNSTGENEIQVTQDVIVERATPPAIPSEAHLAAQGLDREEGRI